MVRSCLRRRVYGRDADQWSSTGCKKKKGDYQDIILGSRLGSELFSHRDVILAVVKRDGYMLKHASEDVKEDMEVVLAAVE